MDQTLHSPPSPLTTALLAATLEDVTPEAYDLCAERLQGIAVQGHCMIVKPASYHLFEPAALLGDWAVHLVGQLRFDIAKLGPQAFADAATDHYETSFPGFAATVRETEEVERFRFSLATPASISELISPSLRFPLSTLHPERHRSRRMTRGLSGSLLLPSTALSSATPCRFIPALSASPRFPLPLIV